jgi:hypothetical protein
MSFQIGRTFNANVQTATAGTITQSAVSGQAIFITDIQGYIDTALGSLTITNSTAAALNTLLVYKPIGSGKTGAFNISFLTPLRTTGVGQTITGVIQGTASASLTMCGYYL